MQGEDAKHAEKKKNESNYGKHRATPVKRRPGGGAAGQLVKLYLNLP